MLIHVLQWNINICTWYIVNGVPVTYNVIKLINQWLVCMVKSFSCLFWSIYVRHADWHYETEQKILWIFFMKILEFHPKFNWNILMEFWLMITRTLVVPLDQTGVKPLLEPMMIKLHDVFIHQLASVSSHILASKSFWNPLTNQRLLTNQRFY